MTSPQPFGLSDDEQVITLVADLGRVLIARKGEILRDMTDRLSGQIEPLDGSTDAHLLELLERSVEGNLDAIFYTFVNDVPFERMQPSTAAVEYAARLAQRDIPAHSLMRAYHMGQDDLMRHVFAVMQDVSHSPELKLNVLNHVSAIVYRYIDWIVQRVLEAYERERERWLSTVGDLRATAIHKVLAGEPVSDAQFASQTGYSLAQQHIGAFIRHTSRRDQSDELSEVKRLVAELCRGGLDGLVMAVDRTSAWAWLPRSGDGSPVDMRVVRAVASRFPDCEIALGAAGQGIEGFRRSHQQALAVQPLLHGRSGVDSRALAYSEPGVAVVSVLARDREATTQWVRDVLGALAVDDPACMELRRTLRVYLQEGESYARAAELLHLHRNSVKYRVTKALAERPEALAEGKTDLAVALQVCLHLGPTVLTPKP